MTGLTHRKPAKNLDPAVAKMIEALARAAARRNYRVASPEPQDQTPAHAPRRHLRKVLNRPAE